MKKVLYMTVMSILGGCVLVFLLLSLAAWKFGGWGPLTAYLNGDVVYFSPKILDIGPCEAGTKTVAVFRMTNLTSKEISVVGEKSSCSCAFAEKIPIIAPPGKTVDVRIGVHLSTQGTLYDQTVSLMVAEPARLALHPVRVTAKILRPESDFASVE